MASNPLEKYLQNNLADFAGLRISGTLPVKQEILNDLLQQVLTDLKAPAATESSSSPAVPVAATGSRVDPKQLLQHVKKADIQAENGRLVLNFEISVTEPDTA